MFASLHRIIIRISKYSVVLDHEVEILGLYIIQSFSPGRGLQDMYRRYVSHNTLSSKLKQVNIDPYNINWPWSLCEDKWPNFDAPLSSLKRFLGRRCFGFELVTFSQFFSQGLYNRSGKPSFLRVLPNIPELHCHAIKK